MKRPLLTSYETWPFTWVTPPELAAYVPCDPRTILRMIDAGSIFAFRVGRCWRIPLSEAKRAFPVERASHGVVPPRTTSPAHSRPSMT